jgi:hypothetical protein
MASQYPYSDHPSPPAKPSAKDAGSGFSRPLGYGEKRALQQEASNRQAVGAPFEDREARMNELRQSSGLKQPRFVGPGG